MRRLMILASILAVILTSIVFASEQPNYPASARPTCGDLVAGHLLGGEAPPSFCEDGKPFVNIHITKTEKAGEPCPIDAVVLIGGYESQAEMAPATECGPLVGGQDSGNYPTEQCPIDGKPILDQHLTDIENEGKLCPVETCGAVITGGRQRQ